jgi:hypothetical protein
MSQGMISPTGADYYAFRAPEPPIVSAPTENAR